MNKEEKISFKDMKADNVILNKQITPLAEKYPDCEFTVAIDQKRNCIMVSISLKGQSAVYVTDKGYIDLERVESNINKLQRVVK